MRGLLMAFLTGGFADVRVADRVRMSRSTKITAKTTTAKTV